MSYPNGYQPKEYKAPPPVAPRRPSGIGNARREALKALAEETQAAVEQTWENLHCSTCGRALPCRHCPSDHDVTVGAEALLAANILPSWFPLNAAKDVAWVILTAVEEQR